MRGGLKTVISNFETFITCLARLSSASNSSDVSLAEATKKCQAILGIARTQLKELLETDLQHGTAEDKLAGFERGCCNVERLMAKSDIMKSFLMGFASSPASSSDASDASRPPADNPTCVQPTMASISATQRLLSPRSGKAPHSSKKPSKRSAPAALKRNDEGKHVRR